MSLLLSHLFASELFKGLIYLPAQPLTGKRSLLARCFKLRCLQEGSCAGICPASPLGEAIRLHVHYSLEPICSQKARGKVPGAGEAALSLVIGCVGDRFVKSDIKIRIGPKHVYHYYSSLNLPTVDFGSISDVCALNLSPPSLGISCLRSGWRRRKDICNLNAPHKEVLSLTHKPSSPWISEVHISFRSGT